MKLPNSTQRLTNVGRTGSGKTVAGLWHLSRHTITTQPWIVFNFKGDEAVDSLLDVGAFSVDLGYIPKNPGIYIVHPIPSDTREGRVDRYLFSLWDRQDVGLFCDEGYMMGDGDGFQAILTQGRSRRMPMIINAQRPAWITRFAFSEADFYQIFDLNDDEDKRRVKQFCPIDIDAYDLPPHHSYYYEVSKKELSKLLPVPNAEETLKLIEQRLPKRKRRFI